MRFRMLRVSGSLASCQVLYLPCSPLQLLDIAGNQLTEIPGGLPESLEYLYLQKNKISAVSANAFDSTPNLKGIFLR